MILKPPAAATPSPEPPSPEPAFSGPAAPEPLSPEPSATGASPPGASAPEAPLTGGPGDHETLARVARAIIAVRIGAVASGCLLLLLGSDRVRVHAGATLVVLAVAMAHALVLLARPRLDVRRNRYAWPVTVADSVFALTIIALTGGASSPVTPVLVLIVVGAAARLSAASTLVLTVVIAAAYSVIAVVSGGAGPELSDRALEATWWPLYLIFTATLGTSLSFLVEREQHSRALATTEAAAEHAAAEEERDLRARLLQAYQSQQDGLRVLLHEFRTPLMSLEALGEALADESAPMSPADRTTSLRLANEHIRHVNEMLDALGDVALSRHPTFASGRVRDVDVPELIVTAADAVGLHPPRLTVRAAGEVRAVRMDAQGLRRVLTNLLENAARHGRGEPVEVSCFMAGRELRISIMDRGPGVPEDGLGELTAKFVSRGDRRGTAGLGLWIVQQILEAMGGRLYFSARDGGGLVSTFHVPAG